MKIAVYGKKIPDQAIESLDVLFKELNKHEIELCINAPFVEFLKGKLEVDFEYDAYHSLADVSGPVDFLLSIGGDGTILDTIVYIGASEIPIIGFNTGRLGFLANNPKEEAHQLVEKLINKQYTLDKRSLLLLETDCDLFGSGKFALNELTVHKKDSSSMVTIHTYINGDYLNSYWSDGLIIATPTGSTAYSLSCGGPILIPQSKNFVINPIAPHNLSARPVIVSDDVEIKLKIEGREEEFLATLDSRSTTITSDTELRITKAPFSINLVQFEGQNFFKTIRNKLLWGQDKRN